MSYSNNPLLPKARAWAVGLVVYDQLPLSIAARKAGVHRTTLWRWYKQWQTRGYSGYITVLPTLSSRPHNYGRVVSDYVISRIRYYRERYKRCATITHAYLTREGTQVSLSTVRRVLKRLGFTLRRRWQRYRAPSPRPLALAPGSFVQTDTIHVYNPLTKQKTYLYTMIDVYSRLAYTEHHLVISQDIAAQVLRRGEAYVGFHFVCVQADNGPEFGERFKQLLQASGTNLRHSRVRKPNDNAHIERFNRTIQDECLQNTIVDKSTINSKILTYLAYYNQERLHLGLQCKTPQEMLQRS
jgi:transposase InsO family protein